MTESPAFWTRPRLTAAVMLLWFPMTLPWWWDPRRTDSHFRLALEPIPARLTDLGAWIRGNSRGDDVFFAGSDVALWIPALTGRRVLRTGMPWLETEAHRDELRILFPERAGETRATLERLGVAFVVADPSLRAEHRLAPEQLDGNPELELAFETDGIKVYRALAN